MISTFYSLSIAKTHPNTSWTRGVISRIDIDVRFNVYLCIQKTIRNYYHTLYTAPRPSSRPALQYAVPLYPRPQRPQKFESEITKNKISGAKGDWRSRRELGDFCVAVPPHHANSCSSDDEDLCCSLTQRKAEHGEHNS